MHGVNLDMLGRRARRALRRPDARRARGADRATTARELGLELRFFQTNSEGEFVEQLHRATDSPTAIVLNPGAWTHYAWAIRDALEIAGLPAVEVHLSDVDAREEWRRVSVIRDLCLATRRRARAPRATARRSTRLKEEPGDGMSARGRAPGRRCVAERELDALLVTDLVNVRYLTASPARTASR